MIETPVNRKRLTRDGSFLGTPCYMAPEVVIDPRSASERSDAYALGVILYQMLAGDPPFTAASPSAILFKQVGELPPPLGQRAPEVPLALCGLVHNLLAKRPAERPTMLEVFQALVRIEQSLSQPLSYVKQSPPKSLLSRSIVWMMPTLCVGVLMAGLSRESWRRRSTLAIPPPAAPIAASPQPASSPPEIVEFAAPAMNTLSPWPTVSVRFPQLRLASETPIASPASIIASPPPSAAVSTTAIDSAAILEAAKQDLQKGLYDQAIAGADKIVKERPYDAWQLIGRAACMKGDRQLAKGAMRRLDPPRQSMVQFACQARHPHLLDD